MGPRVKQERAEVQSSVAESTEREVHFLSWSSWAVTVTLHLFSLRGTIQVQSPTREVGHMYLVYIISLSLNSWNPRLQKMSQQPPWQTGPRDSITSRNRSPSRERKGRAVRLCAAEDSLVPAWVPQFLVLCGGGRYLAC